MGLKCSSVASGYDENARLVDDTVVQVIELLEFLDQIWVLAAKEFVEPLEYDCGSQGLVDPPLFLLRELHILNR